MQYPQKNSHKDIESISSTIYILYYEYLEKKFSWDCGSKMTVINVCIYLLYYCALFSLNVYVFMTVGVPPVTKLDTVGNSFRKLLISLLLEERIL